MLKILLNKIESYKIKKIFYENLSSIKGFNKIKNKFEIIDKIYYELTNARYNFKYTTGYFSKNFTDQEKNTIINQNLWRELGENKLQKKLLIFFYNQKPLIHPLPVEWINILELNGVKINKFYCKSLYKFFIFKKLIISIIKIFIKIISSSSQNKNSNKNKIYFHDFEFETMPKGKFDKFNFIEWFFNKFQLDINNFIVYHNSKKFEDKIKNKNFIFLKKQIYLNSSIRVYCNFFYKCFGCIFSSLRDLIFKNHVNLIILPELIDCQIIKSNNQKFCDYHIFNISNLIHRPLWTYELQKYDSKYYLIFYSINQCLYSYNLKKHKYYWLNIFNWENNIVWDDYQSEVLKNSKLKNINNLIFNTIDFIDNDSVLNSDKDLFISVFDIVPYRKSTIVNINGENIFYSEKNALNFLMDICQIAKEKKINIVIKNKRDFKNNKHSKKYIRLCKTLEKEHNVIFTSKNISPRKIIKNSIGVINMPITSTAIIAKEMNKETCFYDSLSQMTNDKKILRHIKLVQGKSELRNWFDKILKMNLS